MSNQLLKGYAIAIPGLPADHTYALSDAGDRWPCGGRCAGGALICQAPGNLRLARCLAGADNQAGIVYSVTGVCHQIANRILYACGQTVCGARGYGWSVFVYGPYGLDAASFKSCHPVRRPWRQLQMCRRP
ncbi:hypothetical protein ACLB1G_13690 [Oxalobacteraceae bacterium A2-2]